MVESCEQLSSQSIPGLYTEVRMSGSDCRLLAVRGRSGPDGRAFGPVRRDDRRYFPHGFGRGDASRAGVRRGDSCAAGDRDRSGRRAFRYVAGAAGGVDAGADRAHLPGRGVLDGGGPFGRIRVVESVADPAGDLGVVSFWVCGGDGGRSGSGSRGPVKFSFG